MTEPADQDQVTDQELVTVAVAAKALGLDPKQVRRYAEKLTGQDRTPSGHVPLRVRVSAIQDLRAQWQDRQQGVSFPEEADFTLKDTPQGQDKDTRTYRTVRPVLSHRPRPLPVVVYQQRIADLEAQLADRQARIDSLETDKAKLFEALAREQALRALAPPQDAPQEAMTADMPERPNSVQGSPGSSAAASEVSEGGATERAAQKPSLWQRLFGGR